MSVRPKKGLGQHFLAEPSIVRQIVKAVQAPPEVQVVEIGPGEGAMTGALLARYPDLIALEIDSDAIWHLRQRFPALDLREGDVLDVKWSTLAREGQGTGDEGLADNASGQWPVADDASASGARGSEAVSESPTRSPLREGEGQSEGATISPDADAAESIAPKASGEAQSQLETQPPLPAGAGTSPRGGVDAASGEPGALSPRGGPSASPQSPEPSPRLHVVGNLPYYITSPILFSLLDAREHVARAVVMVQKEVADRIVAPEGSKTYGTLSVYFALLARAELILNVPPQAFRPPPKVDSAVLVIDFTDPPEAGLDSEALRRVVRAAFGQRRKMMRNSLKSLAAETGREVPEWASTLRPEQVSPNDFVRLTHAFFSP